LVFITGGSSGIGQALAVRFYQAGYRLALVARQSEVINAWFEQQDMTPTRCRAYAADVRDFSALAAVAQACMAEQGLPSIVIANAGISEGIDTAEFEDLEVMRATFETNNLGLAATFHPFLRPLWARRSGTLVGIASVAGIRGLPGHGAYCASKAAVISYCESLRIECKPHGVRVMTLLPGYVATPLTAENRYPMPFLMQPNVFADKAFRAIESGASYRVIPWQMGVAAQLMRMLPNAWFDRLVTGRARKQRKGHRCEQGLVSCQGSNATCSLALKPDGGGLKRHLSPDTAPGESEGSSP
jgi:short-subunit dehydrogenase